MLKLPLRYCKVIYKYFFNLNLNIKSKLIDFI